MYITQSVQNCQQVGISTVKILFDRQPEPWVVHDNVDLVAHESGHAVPALTLYSAPFLLGPSLTPQTGEFHVPGLTRQLPRPLLSVSNPGSLATLRRLSAALATTAAPRSRAAGAVRVPAKGAAAVESESVHRPAWLSA